VMREGLGETMEEADKALSNFALTDGVPGKEKYPHFLKLTGTC
jgi:hypothetical protein